MCTNFTSLTVLERIITASNQQQKQVAILLDPDRLQSDEQIEKTVRIANDAGVDYLFVGGSLLVSTAFNHCIDTIKSNTEIPVVIFPGSPLQISDRADAILFLSLISGRNPEALIGHHVIAAPKLKALGVETLPTGYMLIDSGRQTTASYMSNTTPIPHDKADIAMSTAIAGEMLGLRLIYMDGGSGAQNTISAAMIRKVKAQLSVPLIVGGGIRTAAGAKEVLSAGADIIVVGNATEENPNFIYELASLTNAL